MEFGRYTEYYVLAIKVVAWPTVCRSCCSRSCYCLNSEDTAIVSMRKREKMLSLFLGYDLIVYSIKLIHLFKNSLCFSPKFNKIISYSCHIQSDTKKRELLKNPTKIEEIQEKKLLAEIKPL